MISIVIMIVVILILAVIAFWNSTRPIEQTLEVKYHEELGEVKKALTSKRLTNSKNGLGEESVNKGFTKVTVENAPEGFVSFNADGTTGYVVDLSLIGYQNLSSGRAYQGINAGDTVTFDEDDVYVYDKDGNVFYVKGYVLSSGDRLYTDDLDS